MHNLCFKCKGRNFCNRGFCVLRQKLQTQKEFNEHSKKDFFGENYNIFVGRFGYPNINVGLLNIDEPRKDVSLDNPIHWAQNDYDINTVIKLRSNLINSNFKTQIKGFKDRFMDIMQELSLSTKPVDTEVILEKKPEFKLTFNQEASPYGPTIKLEKARITENPHIPTKVESVVNDDIKANEGLNLLYNKGFDENYLTKILSAGNLGLDNSKKLVPTRWAITAVDDGLGKNLIAEIKEYPIMSYQMHFGGYLGNYYVILCFPEMWSYELFETLVSTKEFGYDSESYAGRKQYAYNTAGGYYAARFAILQGLSDMKRQGSILALRFVTDEYWAPLGVWVVREAVKKTINTQPIRFNTKEEMIRYAKDLIKTKFDIDINMYISKSSLTSLGSQRKLADFQ